MSTAKAQAVLRCTNCDKMDTISVLKNTRAGFTPFRQPEGWYGFAVTENGGASIDFAFFCSEECATKTMNDLEEALVAADKAKPSN